MEVELHKLINDLREAIKKRDIELIQKLSDDLRGWSDATGASWLEYPKNNTYYEIANLLRTAGDYLFAAAQYEYTQGNSQWK